jgi:hypothetical protein
LLHAQLPLPVLQFCVVVVFLELAFWGWSLFALTPTVCTNVDP